jgi:DHA3 family tetracycline resistance protein-like MFS transporter
MGLSLSRPALVRSLGCRPFALLWTGQTVSRVGDSLYEIALAWWVLQHTGSPAAMATVLICAFTPMLLFLLVGGVAVDRLPRGRVMSWSRTTCTLAWGRWACCMPRSLPATC